MGTKKKSNDERRKNKQRVFVKVLTQHYPEFWVSYNPPFGSACFPTYMNEDTPISEDFLEKIYKIAKIR